MATAVNVVIQNDINDWMILATKSMYSNPSYKEVMKLYDLSFNLCIKQCNERLFLMCYDLFRNYCENLPPNNWSLSDSKEAEEIFIQRANTISKATRYLNRFWIATDLGKTLITSGGKGCKIKSVIEMAQDVWDECITQKIIARYREFCLKTVLSFGKNAKNHLEMLKLVMRHESPFSLEKTEKIINKLLNIF